MEEGWYPDPGYEEFAERYFDGSAWTEHTRFRGERSVERQVTRRSLVVAVVLASAMLIVLIVLVVLSGR